ncbi:MAG TPA: pyridoxamine 5'-phosphate oxidase family protein [Burkholderiaceae bacterium]|nr:pyridoxamine 5'-phosphate oxidase family protein [Burkholderiaceae bacterium]
MDTSTRHDPFHAGEQALQQRVGVRERIAEAGARMVRDQMPEQHRELFGQLPFVLVGSVDAAGQPHASLLAGPPAFMRTPDAHTLAVDALPHAADPLAQALRVGASLGVLGIEPHTRRRNRLNGVVSALRANGFDIGVRQSFGNCPKYIQARQAQWQGGDADAVRVVSAARLDEAGAALVQRADTFFIASSVPPAQLERSAAHGVDVSHRGGNPGFVRVEPGGDGVDTLTVPDFSGNNLFNTLGNLSVHPRAGLLFIDFEGDALMQLSVDAEIVWDGPVLAAFAGAQRLLRYRVRAMRRFASLPGLRWGAAQRSPFLQATGTWSVA